MTPIRTMPRRAQAHHAVAAATLLALHVGAGAQQATPGQLQTITVTAERRLENIRDVPSSVTALQGEILEVLNSGGQDIRQLAGRVPSLNIESSFGRIFPRFYIRGLGNSDFDLNASQPVSLVYDDVVQENPILKGFPIFDIERIEVLNGPQGTLFGRNSPAGVVKFESAKPGKAFEGYGLASIGRFSSFNLEGAVNVPVSDVLSLRFSGLSQNRSDWIKNSLAGAPAPERGDYADSALRAQALLTPSKDLSVLFNLHHRRLDGDPRVFQANAIKPGTNDLVDGFSIRRISQDGVSAADLSSTGGSVRVRWDLGNGMALSSITARESVELFSRTDVDGGSAGQVPFPAETGDGIPKHSQVTQEFRLESTTAGALKWLAGLYYFDEKVNIDSYSYNTGAGNVPDIYANQEQKNTAWAAFGSVNVDVSPTLKLRGGVRYTRDKKDFVANRVYAGFGFIGQRTAATSASNTSGDFSATYAVDANTNVYARVATGFRAPSIQGRLLFGDTLSVADSERITSYEAGVKADLWNKRARAAFSVFSYEMKGQQLTAVGGATNFARLLNAAKTTGQGAEFSFTVLPTDNLLLNLSGSYNQTKIKDPNLYDGVCGAPCTVTDPTIVSGGTTLALLNGNPLPQAPRQVMNGSARWNIPAGSGDFYVLADVSYRSKVNFFLFESVEFTGKPLTEVGLRTGYVFGNGKYEAAAFVRNLTNQIRAVGGINFNNFTGFVNEPRIFGASFKASF